MMFALALAALLASSLAAPSHAQAPAAAPAVAKVPAVIKPGDNLVAEGLPEIPAEIADAVGRYTEFRSASLASWHPTKRELLITTRFGDTTQVHEVRFPGTWTASRSRPTAARSPSRPTRRA